MSRIALTSRDVAMKNVRRRYVPVASTLAAALLVILPIVATRPIVPDFGFMVLISWRLLRPELWAPAVALPLGFFNDFVAGLPIGQSMAVWTMAFLILDFVDSRPFYRDYWMDWLLAAALILFHSFGAWLIARMIGSRTNFEVLWPQIALSVLAYPVIARFIVALDRWRLSR